MYDWFWNPKFWLPKNYTWEDLNSDDPEIYYGRPRDLIYSVPLAIILFFLRRFVEKYIWEPIGRCYGLKHRRYVKLEENKQLELEYKYSKRPKSTDIKNLKARYGIDEMELQRWFRLRRNQDKSDILTKYTESGWRFAFYITVFIIGCWVLHDKDFVWNTRLMWTKVPFNNITPSMFWYIMVELAYYLSSIITYFFDVKRKDFWQMLLHHVATISLIVLAWILNYIPISLYILCIHDFVDYMMEAAKMFKYIKKDTMCNIFFALFTVAWFVSRLVVYPIKIVYSAFFEVELDLVGSWICRIFLLVLQVLHVMWFIMILRIAIQAFDKTGIHKDSRSDSEMSLSEGELKKKVKSN